MKKKQHKSTKHTGKVEQLRLPKPPNEVLGIVIQRLANRHFYVKCEDGKVRFCRVPGSFKFKRMWIREDDIVIVEIPSIQGDVKGEIIYAYSDINRDKLEEQGLLDFVNSL